MILSADKIDAGDIWLKEDLDLEGDSINCIFGNLINCSTKLLNSFLSKYPLIKPQSQNIDKAHITRGESQKIVD